MTLTINIPDAVASNVVDNICSATDFATLNTGQSKAVWAKQQVIENIKRLNSAGAMRIARESQSSIESQIT